jgi:hypothetical protein
MKFIENRIGDKDQGLIITKRGMYPKELCQRAGSHMVTPESSELRWFDFDSYRTLLNFFRKNGKVLDFEEDYIGEHVLVGYCHTEYEIKGLGRLVYSKGEWMDDYILFKALDGSKTSISEINEYTKYH